MEINSISILEKKSLDADRIYFKIEISWDNNSKETLELWGIEDNILVSRIYNPNIEKIIYYFNHHEGFHSSNKYFYPLRYFIKETPLKYEVEIRKWMIIGRSNYIKEVSAMKKAYLFYDSVSNVMIPLCQYDWLVEDADRFEKIIIDSFGEIALTTTYALVAKWSIKRDIHLLWKIKDYSKRYLLLEDSGIYDEQLEKIQNSFVFTCPVCHDSTTPAGIIKFPKPFYNLNKEILGTQVNGTFKVKISDPNSKLDKYSEVENILSSFSSKECPITISYNQYKKIANNEALMNRSLDYKDYVRMIKQLGGEFVLPWEITSETQIEHLHNNTIREYNLHKDQSTEAIKTKYLKLKEEFPKFETQNDQFIIKYPDDIDDLNVEGATLHHCVRSYKGSILDGTNIIVFLRTVDDPDTPFVTMQLKKMSPGKYDLVQAHGTCNCSIKTIDGVYDFVKSWCDVNQITMENIDRAL